jgi:hypothetical protein
MLVSIWRQSRKLDRCAGVKSRLYELGAFDDEGAFFPSSTRVTDKSPQATDDRVAEAQPVV